MANIGGTNIGVIGFLVGLLLTLVGWYMVVAISEAMPIALLSATYWIGFIINWTLAVIITPFMIITRGRGTFLDAGKGMTSFFVMAIFCMITYWTIPPILDSVTLVENMNSIIWIFLGTTWFVALVIIPAYLTTKNYQQEYTRE
jgi:hypothetical protein